MRSHLRVLLTVVTLIAGALVATPAHAATARVWAKVSAGGSHTCAITTTGALYCWGDDTKGQVGDGQPASSSTRPVRVAGAWEAVSAGYQHTCGINTADGLYCWGYNGKGQLGDGTSTDRFKPRRVGTGTWSSVSAGWYHTCGITTAQKMYCWGQNNAGTLGQGSADGGVHATPLRVGKGIPWVRVSAGYTQTCASSLPSYSTSCWGANNFGQLGAGTTTNYYAPEGTGKYFRGLATGATTSCGVTDIRDVYCWGDSAKGQTGTGGYGSGAKELSPALVEDTIALAVGTISGTSATFCVVDIDRAIACWGNNASYQYGDGTTSDARFPRTLAQGAGGWAKVSAGNNHTCGVRTNGRLFCWGSAFAGQVGDGSDDEYVTTPSRVL